MKHTYIIIVATFLFGFLGGMILFLYNNVGKEDTQTSDTVTVQGTNEPAGGANSMVIAAYRYGGCTRSGGCASYRITDDGKVVYVLRGREGDSDRYEDVLSTEEIETLFKTLHDTDLKKVSESTFSGTCPADNDGTAYRFDVTYDGDEYRFDTCTHALAREPFFLMLRDYFDVFNNAYVE